MCFQRQQSPSNVTEVLALLRSETSSLSTSLRVKGSFYSGLHGSAGPIPLPLAPCPASMAALTSSQASWPFLSSPHVPALRGMFMPDSLTDLPGALFSSLSKCQHTEKPSLFTSVSAVCPLLGFLLAGPTTQRWSTTSPTIQNCELGSGLSPSIGIHAL